MLDYVGLIINYLRKSRVGGLERYYTNYPYLKHIIQLWPRDQVNQMAKMNEAVSIKNIHTMNGVGKRLVHPFKGKYFLKFIGFIISAVTYGKKGHELWIEMRKDSCRMAPPKLQRYFCVNTNL